MKKVLVVGLDEQITNVIVRLLNNMSGYYGIASNSIDEMLDTLRNDKYDILLIGAGFSKEHEDTIRQKAYQIQPDLKVLEHFGGGSGLLLSELEELLNNNGNYGDS